MSIKKFTNGVIFSFPVQLLIMHFKKSQLLLLYWFILFLLIFEAFANKYGIPYLFFDPEYLGKVGWISFFLMGITLGIFILAFNISSYLLNSFRFPFLATLSRTFLKYSLNNSIIPIFFIVIYLVKVFYFQKELQFIPTGNILLFILTFFLGIVLVLF